MASDNPETPEKLIFDTTGDVLLIFTHHPVDRDGVKAGNDSANSHKRKVHCYRSNTVTMLVSSKHLKLASPVFRAMLKQDRFKEGIELQANGEVKIRLPDEDPIAFSIIANVIHHRNKLIPEYVAPMLLAKITLLTNQYQIHEAMSLVKKCWTAQLCAENHTLTQYESMTTGGLVYLAYFDYLPLEFKQHTRRAIICNDENFADWMNEHGDGWPYTIVEARLKAFGELFSLLDNLITTQIANAETCDQCELCDLVTIGSLMQFASENHLYPFPKAPYQGLSLKAMFEKMSNAKIDTWCSLEAYENLCGNVAMLSNIQQSEMQQIESKIEGLHLENFRFPPE